MTWDLLEKSGFTGGGWELNESNLTLNQDKDLDTGSDVLLNALGSMDSWSNINKS